VNEKTVSFSENEGSHGEEVHSYFEVEERKKLSTLIGSGREKARKLTRARILLKADEGWQDREICKALDVSIPTVERVRKRYVFEGFEASHATRSEYTVVNWMVNKRLA
jgi:DNA-directed RNA polymerase specialized sigma24 family protein